ncbi:hypothetical protein F2Q68_00009987 [Brassica cretica]|uniref:Uncharacterized protein n=1 Tax=Brassica cretica TaxID=69181 RepID=A0A8S9KX58_BRACR|nr:hypothetical protein F2Q68_00009987 [Brassica cretica]
MNNRLPFYFRRTTETELRRVEDNHRERSRRREPPTDTLPLEATEQTSPRGVTEETKKTPSSKRGFERER